MKFNILCFVLLLLRVGITQAQDIIITLQNDTIHCQIVDVLDGRILYEQPGNDGFVVGKSLSADQIIVYYRNPVRHGTLIKPNKPNIQRNWRLGVQGGIGYMLASTADSEKQLVNMGVSAKTAKDLCKNLNVGYGYGADIHYLSNHWGGIGIKYSGFYSADQADITINVFDGINFLYTNLKKRAYVNFIGLSFCTQQWLDLSNTFKFTSNTAIGYTHYRDEEKYEHPLLPNYLSTGKAFGGNVNATLEYFPLSRLSIGVTAGYFGAWIREITISDGRNKQTIRLKEYNLDNINLSRLDLLLGIRFYL